MTNVLVNDSIVDRMSLTAVNFLCHSSRMLRALSSVHLTSSTLTWFFHASYMSFSPRSWMIVCRASALDKKKKKINQSDTLLLLLYFCVQYNGYGSELKFNFHFKNVHVLWSRKGQIILQSRNSYPRILPYSPSIYLRLTFNYKLQPYTSTPSACPQLKHTCTHIHTNKLAIATLWGTPLFSPLENYSHNAIFHPQKADRIKATIVCYCSSTPTR